MRPWTDSLDLNQLKQSCESQAYELSRANIHLQTLRTKITQLEYELSDTQKEMESQTFVIDHLQDTIQLFSASHEDNSSHPSQQRASKPSSKMIVSTLCRELIKAHKAQSTAMIKLRVACQSEITLQETISSREKRINELKQHLNTTHSNNKRGASSSNKGRVMDILKSDRKVDELILEVASKDAEIRHLKKKLSIEQSKITVVYDIKPLQEMVDKIDAFYHQCFGTKFPFKFPVKSESSKSKVHIHQNQSQSVDVTTTTSDMDTLYRQIESLKVENRNLKSQNLKSRSSETRKPMQQDVIVNTMETINSMNHQSAPDGLKLLNGHHPTGHTLTPSSDINLGDLLEISSRTC